MDSSTSGTNFVRFSTHDIPAAERIPFWREVFAREICHIDIEPHPDCPLEADATMLALPGLNAGWCHSLTPACWKRTSEHVKDGCNDIALLMPVSGSVTRAQLGRDLEVNTGDGVCILHNEPASMRFQNLAHLVVMVPRAALAPIVANVEDASTQLIPGGSEAVALLRSYLRGLFEIPVITDPALCKLVVTHIYDLVATAIGTTREGGEIALRRGVRAGRLNAIKADFIANPDLTLTELAARQRVTPRYVQMLFEESGTSYSSYAQDVRLGNAYRMLRGRRYAEWTISAIAFEAGFGDLSHFNRSFRQRFGASPSEIWRDALLATRSDG